MSRTVFCRKFQEELEGLDRAPYPGPVGQKIYDTISKKAWVAWTEHQTMLINEKHLNLMDAQSRKFLQEEMEKFFAGEDYAKAEGYVPPTEAK